MRPVYHVVVIDGIHVHVVGPYFSFERAEGDADAWMIGGRRTCVVPRILPEEYVLDFVGAREES